MSRDNGNNFGLSGQEEQQPNSRKHDDFFGFLKSKETRALDNEKKRVENKLTEARAKLLESEAAQPVTPAVNDQGGTVNMVLLGVVGIVAISLLAIYMRNRRNRRELAEATAYVDPAQRVAEAAIQ